VLVLALSLIFNPVVIDGDTVRYGNDRVRLVQIDTPEKGECYHDEAKALLKKLIGKARVSVVSDKSLDKTDEYGRKLAYLYVGKQNLNVEMVRQGAGVPYFYNQKRGQYSLDILKAYYYAKENRLGKWGQCGTGN
jgi:micrococcal nuclease